MCEATWAMYGKTPKCDLCLVPLMPDNQVVFDVYMEVRDQHIMGFGGPVDINFMSVKLIMDLMDIEVESQKAVFDRVYKLYRKFLSKMYDDAKE